ncbi:MAG: aminotransferase class I/II-fold pyridoxal phosphate-dependent enzyme, partial [Candidatus Micrarchaeaceae archaeon]
MFTSKLSGFAASPIREDAAIAKKLTEEGKRVIALNSGDPPKYFPTPEYLIKEYARALRNNYTFYEDSQGASALRDTIAKRYKNLYGIDADPNRIIVTQGASEALLFLNLSLLNPKEKAALISPYYASYEPFIRVAGGTPIIGESNEEEKWSIDLDGLNKLLKKNRKIKYLLITSPNNPTGAIIKRKEMEELAEIANELDILLISDEIYDELVFSNDFVSLSQIAKDMPYVILNGVSKSLNATGIRIGYLLI